MALNATILADLQGDLGIDNSEAVFTDLELERIYARASSDYNTAVYMAWRQLLAASSKYVDYAVAQTKVSRSQAFQHIKDMVAFWGAESKSADDQLLSAGMRGVPTKHKPQPADDQRSGYFRRGRWVSYANN